MELDKKNINNADHKVNTNKKFINSQDIGNLNYLYPNGHRTTHQMRWIKLARDRGLSSNIDL